MISALKVGVGQEPPVTNPYLAPGYLPFANAPHDQPHTMPIGYDRTLVGWMTTVRNSNRQPRPTDPLQTNHIHQV